MKNFEFKSNYHRPWRASYLDREAAKRYNGLEVKIYVHARNGVYTTGEFTIGDIDADGYLHELNGNSTDLHLNGGCDYTRNWFVNKDGDKVDFNVTKAFDWCGDSDFVDGKADEVTRLDDDELMARYGLTPEQAEILIEDEFGWAEYAENERKFNEDYEPDDYYRENDYKDF